MRLCCLSSVRNIAGSTGTCTQTAHPWCSGIFRYTKDLGCHGRCKAFFPHTDRSIIKKKFTNSSFSIQKKGEVILLVGKPTDWKFLVEKIAFTKIIGIFQSSWMNFSFSIEFQYLVALRKHYSLDLWIEKPFYLENTVGAFKIHNITSRKSFQKKKDSKPIILKKVFSDYLTCPVLGVSEMGFK